MTVDLLEQSRAAFLHDVSTRVPPRLRGVDFAEILDSLVRWSQEPTRRLVLREPGDQHTVSFGLPNSEAVLWSAYPRNEDGAKVVVLPKRFRRLPRSRQEELLQALHEVAPSVRITGTALLQFPMHLLCSDAALSAFHRLLAIASTCAGTYHGAAV